MKPNTTAPCRSRLCKPKMLQSRDRQGVVLLAGAMFFCATAAAQTPVIVISIDTLRADRLSAYGNRALSTPNIDAFAQHGTLFTNVNSQIPLTLPSHTSLFTSTYPFENGIEENGEVVPAAPVTLASVLESHGYQN